MIEIGRVCVKIAGRDARKTCVVIDVLDDTYVLIDGQTRRRKCNMQHLEPLATILELKKNADHATVIASLESIGVVVEKKEKAKGKKEHKARPVKKKVVHTRPVPVAKKTEKKAKASEKTNEHVAEVVSEEKKE